MELAPCPSCRRHVRIDETACPFCAVELAAIIPRAVPRSGRFSRAAVFAGVSMVSAACGGKAKPPDEQRLENAAVDAGPGAEAPDAAPAIEPDEERWERDSVDMPYGAPPARVRLV